MPRSYHHACSFLGHNERDIFLEIQAVQQRNELLGQVMT